jgi:hypothetical protein
MCNAHTHTLTKERTECETDYSTNVRSRSRRSVAASLAATRLPRRSELPHIFASTTGRR